MSKTGIKKSYITVFPECCSVHLKKDVGMLPYSMGKYMGYDFGLVCYDNGDISPKEKEEYRVTFLEKKKGEVQDFAHYIFQNAKQIDVLNLYHITSERNLYWILAYKLGNPKGKIHIKLDADYRMLDVIDMYPKLLRRKIKIGIFRHFVDLYTVESSYMRNLLTQKWDLPMQLIPNGVFLNECNLQEFPEQADAFLTVGRLGTEQKATEILLEAYRQIADKTAWELWLAGPVEASFENSIKAFFSETPDLELRVKFLGNISDPEQLAKVYGQAKVFVLPSRWESFGLVLLEALERGEYLIVSDQVPSAADVGDNGRFCTVVPNEDPAALGKAMLEAADMQIDESVRRERSQWIRDQFTWEQIVKKLHSYLENT